MVVLLGSIVRPRSDRDLDLLERHVLATDDAGVITHIGPEHDEASQHILQTASDVIELGRHSFIVPGFVDTHLHAPQYSFVGKGYDLPLLEWLNTYTFKAESRIDADPHGLGRRVYDRLCSQLIAHGTTSVSFYGTQTVEANLQLARSASAAGVRAHVGHIVQDQHSPEFYCKSAADGLVETERFLVELDKLNQTLELPAEPVLSPRFLPTCSPALLRGIADIARRDSSLRIQSHLSEGEDEVEFSGKLWPGQTDTEVFESLGLLTDRSLWAHATYLSPNDISILAKADAAIAHCPISNLFFSPHRQLPLVEALQAGVRCGLGSDVAGGPTLDLADNARTASLISRQRHAQKAADRWVGWREALWLATSGGAQALRINTGSFAVGQPFDAQLIDLNRGASFDLFDEQEDGSATSLAEVVEKWVQSGAGGRDARIEVWTQGVARLGSR